MNAVRALAAAILAMLALTATASADGGLLGVAVVDSYVAPKGAYVNIVAPDSAAAAAGIVPGDVIVAADGNPVGGAGDLVAILARHRAGDEIALSVVHFGKPAATVTLALGSSAAAPVASAPPAASRSESMAPPGAMRAPTSSIPVRWVTFTDPIEHAFTIQVPAGWNVAGATRRMSTVEIRTGIEAQSPDGTIKLFYGDLNIPIFTVPSQMLAMGGLRQGMVYNAGYGQQLLIMPYMDGENFAARWGQTRISRDCMGVSIVNASPRPGASRGIDAAYAALGVRTSIQAGEANFACTIGGRRAEGYVFAGTEIVQAGASTLWDVKSLAGFVAIADRAAEASNLLSHMVASFAVDPGWAAQQAQTTVQTNRLVEQTNQIVSNAIIQNGKTLSETTDIIVKGGEARSNQEFKAIENYDEKAVRGTSSYVNPETGTTYGNLDNSKAHQYVGPSGQPFGTDSENAPGPNTTELQRIPPGQ